MAIMYLHLLLKAQPEFCCNDRIDSRQYLQLYYNLE